MSTRQEGKAYHLNVFLQGRNGYHLGRLAQSGVDDLHTGIAKSPSNHFRATIMPIEAEFGDEDADRV
jgi:hypothetical protein